MSSASKKICAGLGAGFDASRPASPLMLGNFRQPTALGTPQPAAPAAPAAAAAAAAFGAAASTSLPSCTYTREGGFQWASSPNSPPVTATSPSRAIVTQGTGSQGAGGMAGTFVTSATTQFAATAFNSSPPNSPLSPAAGPKLQASNPATPVAEQPPADLAQLLFEILHSIFGATLANRKQPIGPVVEAVLAAHGARLTADGHVVPLEQDSSSAEQTSPMDISIVPPSVQMADAPPLMPGQLPPHMSNLLPSVLAGAKLSPSKQKWLQRLSKNRKK